MLSQVVEKNRDDLEHDVEGDCQIDCLERSVEAGGEKG